MSKDFTVKHAAQLLGVTPPTVWYDIKKGRLEAYLSDCGNCYLVNGTQVIDRVKQKDKRDIERLSKRESILKRKRND